MTEVFTIVLFLNRYVPEKLELSVFDPMYKAFANVFENFRISDSVFKIKTEGEDVKPRPEELKGFSKIPKIDLDDDLEEVGLPISIWITLTNEDSASCVVPV